MDMDMHYGHGHAAWAWTHSIALIMQHVSGQWTCMDAGMPIKSSVRHRQFSVGLRRYSGIGIRHHGQSGNTSHGPVRQCPAMLAQWQVGEPRSIVAGNVLHHTYPLEYKIFSSQPRQKLCWASTLQHIFILLEWDIQWGNVRKTRWQIFNVEGKSQELF